MKITTLKNISTFSQKESSVNYFKIISLCLVLFSLTIPSSAFSAPAPETYIPKDCITALTPALQEVGMTLDDLLNSPSKSRDFKNYHKDKPIWQTLASKCVQPNLELIPSNLKLSRCPCPAYHDDCIVILNSCYYNCAACGI